MIEISSQRLPVDSLVFKSPSESILQLAKIMLYTSGPMMFVGAHFASWKKDRCCLRMEERNGHQPKSAEPTSSKRVPSSTNGPSKQDGAPQL